MSHAHNNTRTKRLRTRTPLSCPVTAITQLPPPYDSWAIAASARQLVLLPLLPSSDDPLALRWTVFERERIHKIIWRPTETTQLSSGGAGARRLVEALVLGGKEAALIQLEFPSPSSSSSPELRILNRFALDDVVGDGAFLKDDQIILATLHCSLHIYNLSSPPSPPLAALSPSAATSTSAAAFTSQPESESVRRLKPSRILHAPQRPLLWCASFSSPAYYSSSPSSSAEEGVRIAGGSTWGGTFLWDLSVKDLLGSRLAARMTTEEEEEEEKVPSAAGVGVGVQVVTGAGSLRRLIGHKKTLSIITNESNCSRLVPTTEPSVFGTSAGSTITTPASRPPSQTVTAAPEEATPPYRVWRVAFVPPPAASCRSSSFDSAASPDLLANRAESALSIEPAALRLLSVGEDATCRLWSLADNVGEGTKVLKTWRDGHDGRSIWSVAVATVTHEAGPGADGKRRCEYVLTGGADGAARCWPLPVFSPPSSASPPLAASMGSRPSQGKATTAEAKVTAFRVANLHSNGEEARRRRRRKELVVTLSGDGSFRAYVSTEQSSSASPPAAPLYSSKSFAGSSSSTVIRLLPRPETATAQQRQQQQLYAFSNRGYVLTATLVVSTDNNVNVEDIKEELGEIKANDVEFVDFVKGDERDEAASRRRRAVVWGRAGHRLVVLEQVAASPLAVAVPLYHRTADAQPMLLQDSPLRQLASFELDRSRPSLLPTCLHFLSPALFLVGSIRGHLSLFRITTDTGGGGNDAAVVEIARLERVHSDTINRVVVRQDGEGAPSSSSSRRWLVETVARDGASCLLEILAPAAPGSRSASIRLVDRRQVTKGWLEEILPNGQYLALVDTRSVVLDRLGQTLESHSSPSKKALWQVTMAEAGSTRYYRTHEDTVSHINLEPAPSSPSTLLRGGLHGREIRAVAAFAVPGSDTKLVATAAENGLLTISRLTPSNELEPLYCDRYLPGSYKSLVWAAESSTTSPKGPYTLFACGTRASLAALSVSVVSDEAGRIALWVVPVGDELADEGEEIRAMDLAVAPLHDDAKRFVAVGYSDGIVRTWLHDAEKRTFTPLASSAKAGKCILCVETVQLRLAAEENERTLLVTTASDGLLNLRDISLVLRDPTACADPSSLAEPFFSSRPHPSGINSLAIRTFGGDDNAIVLSAVDVFADDDAGSSALSAHVAGQTSLPSAHSSTIQGLDFLDADHLVSSSVDQRLNLYRFSCAASSADASSQPATARNPVPIALTLEMVDSTCLDVADCSAQALVRSNNGHDGCAKVTEEQEDRILVVGIGAEVVSLGDVNP
ncbi:hypothetical protein JCM10908_001432 [Rhodotorula pacifica]|uniref:uncharacterized protein n=1 Tax=Rhodotorula pacifica TaxID=1495444 RepID=UPI00317268CE